MIDAINYRRHNNDSQANLHLILAHEAGVNAYKRGDFEFAVESFKKAVKGDRDNWDAQFYLGMCLAQLNQNVAAVNQFLMIADFCPDETFRRRARLARQALNAWKQ